MAFTGLDTSAFADAMKTWYLPAIRDQTNRKTVLLFKLKRNEESVGGNFAHMSLLSGGNPGVGSRAEGSALPAANRSRYKKATFPLFSQYGRFSLSGLVTRASSKGSASAYAEAIDTQMQSLMKDLPAEHNRMLFGQGDGVLTTCKATTDKTTVQVNTTQLIKENDIIDMRNLTSGTAITTGGTDIIVLTVDSDTQFTVSVAVTTLTSEGVYRAGSRNEEIFGLKAIASTANPTNGVGQFGNIDRTAAGNGFWKGNVRANGGVNRAQTSGLMQQIITDAEKKGAGETDLFISDHDQWITYGNRIAPQQRFQELIKKMDGGFRFLDFAGIPFTPDKDCQPNRIYALEMASLEIFQHGDYEWMDLDGDIIKWIVGQDEWEAVLVKDMNLGCSHCNRIGVIKDLLNNLN